MAQSAKHFKALEEVQIAHTRLLIPDLDLRGRGSNDRGRLRQSGQRPSVGGRGENRTHPLVRTPGTAQRG
jgi:hypothetical protein